MSELRFVIQNRQRLRSLGPEAGYLAGLDLSPWPAQWRSEDDVLILSSDEKDAPKFFQQIVQTDGAKITLATATLRRQAGDQVLWLELARGTVDRLRNRVSAWQVIGFEPSKRLADGIRNCSLQFCDALVHRDHIPSCETAALEAIDQSLAMMALAVKEYLAWLETQTESELTSPKTLRGTWLTEPVAHDKEQINSLLGLVNTIAIAVDWRDLQPEADVWNWESLDEQLEVANRHQWNVVLGPLLRFDRRYLPPWVMELTPDFSEVRRAVQTYVSRVLERCAARVDLCFLASSVNLAGDTQWEGAARLQLVIDAATGLRQVADNLPFVVGVAQPFSESQIRGSDYPSLHLADGLMRANIDLCGFALELDFGDQPTQTWPRDFCQLFDRLSQWSMFGLPLVVCTSQSHGPNAGAGQSQETLRQPDFTTWLEVLNRSPLVHAVFWSAPVDLVDCPRGLLSSEGQATLAADWFATGFRLSEAPDTHDV